MRNLKSIPLWLPRMFPWAWYSIKNSLMFLMAFFFFSEAHFGFHTLLFFIILRVVLLIFRFTKKMQAIRSYSGTPPPALHEGPPLHIQAGDTVELLRGDAHSLFWQVLVCITVF